MRKVSTVPAIHSFLSGCRFSTKSWVSIFLQRIDQTVFWGRQNRRFDSDRVTRLAEFTADGWLFYFGRLLSKLQKWPTFFGRFLDCWGYALILTKKCLGIQFWRFFYKLIWSPWFRTIFSDRDKKSSRDHKSFYFVFVGDDVIREKKLNSKSDSDGGCFFCRKKSCRQITREQFWSGLLVWS
jgi:hypothetical protein